MKLSTLKVSLLFGIFAVVPLLGQQSNPFEKFGSKVPVQVAVGTSTKKMELIKIDPRLGKIYCNLVGVGQVNYELSLLGEPGQPKGFQYTWPKDVVQALSLAADEQYHRIPDTFIAQKMKPVMYPMLHYLEMPNRFFNIHEQCLTYAKLLIAKENYGDALIILNSINLNALEKAGYREFANMALGLIAKVITANLGARYEDFALKLFTKINLRANNGNDHEVCLRLGDSLRENAQKATRERKKITHPSNLGGRRRVLTSADEIKKAQILLSREIKQYDSANKVYNRLSTIIAPLPNSPIKERARLWPIYCYYNLYGAYDEYAAVDPSKAKSKSALAWKARGKNYRTNADSFLSEIDKKPPARLSNEYSLYKLLRANKSTIYGNGYSAVALTVEGQKAKDYQTKAVQYYNEAVTEVTEGIVSSRVGLAWLPEALLIAASGYENLSKSAASSAKGSPTEKEQKAKEQKAHKEAAQNIYRQMQVFYKGQEWANIATNKLGSSGP